MKLLIASDIHGSAYYCKKLLDKIESESPNKVLLLGDLLYHGPRNDLPKDYDCKQVIEMLNSIKDKILSVRGNCDTEVDQMVLDFPCLSDYAVLFVDDMCFYATHGHIHNAEKPLPMQKGSFMLCGHTHVPKYEKFDDFTYINPGSVSIPKEKSHNGYLIYENKQFFWKDFDANTISSVKI